VRPASRRRGCFDGRSGPTEAGREGPQSPFKVPICTAVLGVSLLVLACNSPSSTCPPASVGSWSADGEPEAYVGDDLFVYINGGAEIYHEYGFEKVTVQRYRRGDDQVSLEIYTMDSDAFGIYSFARSAGGRLLNLGNGATAADYYLHLWRGNELAAVTAETEFDDVSEAVLEIGAAAAACLQQGGSEPDLLQKLPIDDRIPGSEVFFTGQLGFINAARPAATFFSGFEEGAVARYGPEKLTVVLNWQDEAAAEQALRAARQKCADTGGTIAETEDGKVVDFVAKGHRISVHGAESLITLRITKEAP
jgi:hypothetical protein